MIEDKLHLNKNDIELLNKGFTIHLKTIKGKYLIIKKRFSFKRNKIKKELEK